MKPRLEDMHFSHVLGVLKPTRTPEEALLKHKSLARRSQPWSNRPGSMMEILESIRNWISSPDSSFLVLQTQPRAQARVKQLTSELISHLQPQSNRIAWYLSATCPTGDSAASLTDVVRSLLYQFLKMVPNIVAALPNNFSVAKLESQHSDSEWRELLSHVVDHLGSCFIIVEAEDVLADPAEGNRLTSLLQRLIGHCNLSRSAVKVLVVSYDRSWEHFADMANMGGRIIQVRREVSTRKMRRFGGKSIFPGPHWAKSSHR